jgi:hypothetical protein
VHNETYAEFAEQGSMTSDLDSTHNLIILCAFSSKKGSENCHGISIGKGNESHKVITLLSAFEKGD